MDVRGDIYAASLAGGLLGGLSGTSALALQGIRPRHDPPASAPRTAGVAPQTAARAARALLQLADLPSGWAAGPRPAAPTRVSPWSSRLATCVGVPSRIAAVAPTKVDSPDFSSADGVFAVEQVDFVEGSFLYPATAPPSRPRSRSRCWRRRSTPGAEPAGVVRAAPVAGAAHHLARGLASLGGRPGRTGGWSGTTDGVA